MKEMFLLVQYALILFWAYWLFISMFGFGKAKKLEEQKPQKRFALLLPAHNEDQVIGNLIDNLLTLDYPKELYDIILIADNSNDLTAQIGRDKGIVVLENTTPVGQPKGKPYAIKYALDYLGDRLISDYDAIAVFDADNLVTLNYLTEMNNHLLNGERLIQCYLDSKNPNDNWITMAYATSYYYMNRSWQLAKSRLNLGNAIGGTGFCVDTTLMREVGWTARSLTEDLEFTMQCLLKDVPATWAHYARVYDEKPTGFKASTIQRLRWARGHWDVCMKYAPRLLWKGIIHSDFRALDGCLYLLNPGKIVVGAGVSVVLYMNWFLDDTWGRHLIPYQVWLAFVVINVLYIYYCIKSDAEKSMNPIKAFASVIFLNFTYVFLFIWAFITQRNKTWKRTEHTRSISMDDGVIINNQTLEG